MPKQKTITIVGLAPQFQTTSAKIRAAMRQLGMLTKENQPTQAWITKTISQPGEKKNNYRWPESEVVSLLVAAGHKHYPKEERLPRLTSYHDCTHALTKAAGYISDNFPRRKKEKNGYYDFPEYELTRFALTVGQNDQEDAIEALETYFEHCQLSDPIQWEFMKNHPLFQRAVGDTLRFLENHMGITDGFGPLTKSIETKTIQPFSNRGTKPNG